MYGRFHIIVKSGSLVTKVSMELYNKRGKPGIFGMRTYLSTYRSFTQKSNRLSIGRNGERKGAQSISRLILICHQHIVETYKNVRTVEQATKDIFTQLNKVH